MKLKNLLMSALIALNLALLLDGTAHAQTPGAPAEPTTTTAVRAPFKIAPVDDAWRASLPRDANAATQAYLDRLPPAAVQRANDYFEGRYWLQLWNFLLGLGIAALMLAGRRAARLRDWAQRVARGRGGVRNFMRDGLFGAVYSVAAWVLSLPLTIYEGFVREHAYGMATQNFAAWAGEQGVSLLVETLLGALLVAILYAVIRRAGERWWLWGSVTSVAMLVVLMLIAPVWIAPLFNTYKPVEDGVVKASVLAMAHADGVPVENVYEFDASRQTTKVSANVSGIFGTAAVRLNDNLLRRASLPEIRAVMGHELGHYVMNHVYKMLTSFSLLLLAGFLVVKWMMDRLLARYGARWGMNAALGVGDVASLPLFAAAFSVFMFFATPLQNTIIRTNEVEADRFGLNLSREPHGMAEAFLKLSEYRKPDPAAWEEFIFFDHPSARHRIHDSMRWREAMGTP